MPVHYGLPKEGMIYQRDQYEKGGIGRWYWDHKDKGRMPSMMWVVSKNVNRESYKSS
jgi:hypothetical protein